MPSLRTTFASSKYFANLQFSSSSSSSHSAGIMAKALRLAAVILIGMVLGVALANAGTITYTCDPSVDAATCTYLNTTVAGHYSSSFTNANANIYITYGTTGLGESLQYQNFVPYSIYVTALTNNAHKSSIQVAALAALATYDATPYGSGQVNLTAALATALGFSGATGTTPEGGACTIGTAGCYNAIVTITSDPSILYYDNLGGPEPADAYDFYGVVEHETDEVLGTSSCIDTEGAIEPADVGAGDGGAKNSGPRAVVRTVRRVSQMTPMGPLTGVSDGCGGSTPSAVDLFRYSAPGDLILDSSLSTTPGAYFSYNGGTTNGASGVGGSPKFYNTLADGDDYADFLSSSPDCGTNQAIQDADGCPGEDKGLTILNDGGAEINILNAVGYNVVSQSFSCTSEIDFLSQGLPGTQLYEGVYASGSATYNKLGPVQSVDYNALGFNPNDNYLYAMDYTGGTPGTLYKIGSTGNAVSLGLVSGYPGGDDVPFAGAFDPSGNYWISGGSLSSAAYEIDVSSNPPAIINTVVLTQAWAPADFSYSAGYMWGLNGTTIYRLDLATGEVYTYSAPSAIVSGEYGAAWTFGSSSGDLGFSNNETGDIYRISITNPSTTPTFTVVAHYTGPSSNANDGAACFATEPVDLEMSKTGPATVAPGGAISWTLTVTNNGPGNSSGFAVTDSVPAGVTSVATTTAGCQVSGNNVLCSEGALADSGTFTITITGNAPSSGCVTNTATVNGIETDPTPDNNSGSVQTCTAKTSTVTSVEAYDAATDSLWSGNEVTGASAYATSTVLPTPTGGPTPTGSVTNTLYGGNSCTGFRFFSSTQPLVSGTVPDSATSPPLGAGAYSFQASYSGDQNYTGSSACYAFSVSKATISITVTSVGPSSEAYGQDSGVTITAVLSGSSVGFSPAAGAVNIGGNGPSGYSATSCGAPGSGTLTCTATYTPTAADTVGTYTETASFSGDANYTGSSSTQSNNFSITQASTTTSVGSGQNPSLVGQPVTFTATIDGEYGLIKVGNGASPPGVKQRGAHPLIPTGSSVTWSANTGCSSSPVTSLPAMVTCNTSALPAGNNTITASYSGDINHTGSMGTLAGGQAVDQAPAITSASSTTFTAGAFGTFAVTTTGYPTPSIMESGGLPGGVSFVDNHNGTGTLSGTPTSGGLFSISFTAANGVGSNAVQAFTLTVLQAPGFTGPNSAVFTIGVAGSFTLTTKGYPYPSLTESGHIPTGLTFVDNGNGTATLAGTPLIFVGGDFPITITAKNGIGAPVTESFTIIVQQPPSFTSANNAVFVYGVPNAFTVTTSAFPVASIHEAGTLPPWLTFVDNGNGTATLSGTPSYVSGTFAFVLTATNVVATATQNFTLDVSGLNLTPSNLVFGTVYLNSSHTLPVTVTNVGSTTVTISGVSITPGTANAAAYTAADHCTTPLKAGKSCVVDVTFKADAEGTLTATLNLMDNAVGMPQHVGLTGNVIDPVAQFSPTKLAFGTVTVHSSSTLPVQLTNSGQTPLDISGISIGGADAGDFSQTNNCPAIMAAGASCTISVTFDPTVKGARTGTLIFTDNVASGQSTVALTGTGH